MPVQWWCLQGWVFLGARHLQSFSVLSCPSLNLLRWNTRTSPLRIKQGFSIINWLFTTEVESYIVILWHRQVFHLNLSLYSHNSVGYFQCDEEYLELFCFLSLQKNLEKIYFFLFNDMTDLASLNTVSSLTRSSRVDVEIPFSVPSAKYIVRVNRSAPIAVYHRQNLIVSILGGIFHQVPSECLFLTGHKFCVEDFMLWCQLCVHEDMKHSRTGQALIKVKLSK